MPKAVPYGIYDLSANTGWVTVGSDGDTAVFAVATLAAVVELLWSDRSPTPTPSGLDPRTPDMAGSIMKCRVGL